MNAKSHVSDSAHRPVNVVKNNKPDYWLRIVIDGNGHSSWILVPFGKAGISCRFGQEGEIGVEI
jgi:hypothetical protein